MTEKTPEAGDNGTPTPEAPQQGTSLAVVPLGGVAMLAFAQPTMQLRMSPDDADKLGLMLIRTATLCRGQAERIDERAASPVMTPETLPASAEVPPEDAA